MCKERETSSVLSVIHLDKKSMSHKAGWNERIILKYRPRWCRLFCLEFEEKNEEEHIREYSVNHQMILIITEHCCSVSGKWREVVIARYCCTRPGCERREVGNWWHLCTSGHWVVPSVPLSSCYPEKPRMQLPLLGVMNKAGQVLKLNESLLLVL